MKIIEGMKKIKINEKRITRNCDQITRYSSLLDTEKPFFDSEDVQKKEVKSLVQSSKDLINECIKLKQRIEKTNLETVIEFNGEQFAISALLMLKRKYGALLINIFNSLNDGEARKRFRGLAAQPNEKRPTIIRLFREEDKNKELQNIYDLLDNITSRLEVINATTELLD